MNRLGIKLATAALWKLSDLLRTGAERLDDAATKASRLGYRLDGHPDCARYWR